MTSYWDSFKRYVQTLNDAAIDSLFEDNPVLRDAAKLVKQEPDISLRKAAERLGVAKSSLSKMVKDWVLERGIHNMPLPEAKPPAVQSLPEEVDVGKVVEAAAAASGSRRSSSSSSVRGSTQVVKTAAEVRRLLERSIKDDIEHVLTTYSLPVEPKLPILLKEVRDTAWWLHVTHDLGVIAFTMLAPLAADNIDLKDPAKTVQAMAATLKAVLEAVEKRDAEIQRLKTELERVKAELEAYKRGYQEAVRALDEMKRMMADLKHRVQETLRIALHTAPAALAPHERAKYFSVAVPALKRVWGEALVTQ